MMKKKIAVMVLGGVMALSLAACGSSSGGNNADNGTTNTQTDTADGGGDDGAAEASAGGETYDTGVFSVTVPDGWTAADYPDVFQESEDGIDHNSLYVIKGGASADDILTYPYIMITYAPDTTYWDMDMSDMYDDYEVIESMEINGQEWAGYSYSSLDVPGVFLYRNLNADSDEGYVSVSVVLEASKGSVSIEDADVQEIISSIEGD